MEENDRLRRLVQDSGTVPAESGIHTASPAERTDQDPRFVADFTWELPASQALEEVQLDGLAIRDLFEQYTCHPCVS